MTKSKGYFNPNLFVDNSAWSTLSMQDKASMMEVAVRNGITNLADIKKKYNEFAGGGAIPQTDWSYDSWKKQIALHKGLDVDRDRTYDYEGFFRKYPQEAWGMLMDPKAHFTDEFKTVYHSTFSTQSKYSGISHSEYNPQGLKGGTWNKQGSVLTMSPDGYKGPVSMDERRWYIEDNEDNGVQLREADGSLPVYDGIPWGGVLPTVTVTGRKHGFGGPLVDYLMNEYADGGNLFYPGGKITYGRPYYSYDENGRKIDGILNYNATLPEIIITPDSRKSPAERAVLERERRANHDRVTGKGTYDAMRDSEWTGLQVLAAQKEWEESAEKKALDYAQAAATGVGIGADIVSGLPVYSSLKGASVLSRAETPLEYAEGALWLAPLFTNMGAGIYNNANHLYNNVQDLNSLKAFNDKYGYSYVKPKYTLIFDDVNMDRVFDHAVKRHNTFVRGVDPHETQRFGRLTDMTPEEAARYSMTHIPKVYKGNDAGLLEGENALYVSNDFPTAAGYANEGSGYIGIIRRPIKYGQSTRRKFLEDNDFIFSRPPGRARQFYTTTDEPNTPWITKEFNTPDSPPVNWKYSQPFEVRANAGAKVIERGDSHFRHYLFVGDVGDEPVELLEMYKPTTYGAKDHRGIGALGLSRKKKFGGKK